MKRTCRGGWGITVFEYRQAEEIRDAFARHGVRYLFIGKSGAILREPLARLEGFREYLRTKE